MLNNSAIHANSDKPIELRVSVEDEDVRFSIRDYGIGIPEDRLENVFDGAGYNQEEVGPDSHRGMGIGLSICKTIVAAHGGTISAKIATRVLNFRSPSPAVWRR